MTPSGLIMGTILKINEFRSSLASSAIDVMKLMNPRIIQLPLVSPGWQRDVTTMPLFFFCSASSHGVDMDR